jgi:hypothetical protein
MKIVWELWFYDNILLKVTEGVLVLMVSPNHVKTLM